MNTLISTLNLYFGQKAPQLPTGLKEGIVKFSPYLTIIGLIIFAFSIFPLILLILGVSAISTAVGQYASTGGMMVSLVFLIVIELMYLIALPGLFKRNISGWNMIFYAQLVSILSQLIQMNIVGAILSALIGFYFLFQVRAYYAGEASVGAGSTQFPPQTPNPMM
jgi:hypothetical protein